MNEMMKLGLLLLLAAALLLTACAGGDTTEAEIGEFIALDMPHDDGSGVLLKWKPLGGEHRIIQYNIYRGASPDSLFLLSRQEVDPNAGVAGNWLNFEDKDFNPLIEFETAPGKLKKEKQQVAEGTLYKGVPRDTKILGEMLRHYDVIGDIKTSKYYNGSQRVELGQGEDKEVWAGYRLNQFNNLYANPKAEHSYYYCVVPVSETGKFLAATPVLKVVPVNNRPDSTAVLHTSYLTDTNELRFEWSPPLGSENIVAWEAWLMPRSLLPQFQADQKANATAPDSVFNANWQQGSILVHQMEPSYWSQSFYDKVDLNATQVRLPAPAELANWVPVLTYANFWSSEDGSRQESYQAAALGEKLQIKASADLPRLPDFRVLDKVYDKGDNIIVSFGRPFAFVTQASWVNKAKTRLRVNYEIADNGHEKVSRLRLRFLDADGKMLDEVLENYPDKIIHANLPAGRNPETGFSVEVFTELQGEGKFPAPPISQKVVYDPQAYRFNGGTVTSANQELNRIYYDIFSKNNLSGSYSPGKRIGALSRYYEHLVPYEDTQMPLISKIDPKTGLVLTDPHFTVAVDPASGATLSPSLYKQDMEEHLKGLAAGIAELKQTVAPGDTLSEAAQELKASEAELAFIKGHPAYQAGSKATNDKAWRRVMLKELDQNSRAYQYELLATNGKGLWADQSDQPELKPSGPGIDAPLHPRGEWFDKTKLATLLASIILGLMVVYAIFQARRKDLYIRPIAGLEELDNAVGRATEMGRPVMFVPGWGTLGDPCTISAMMILNKIGGKAAEYDIRLIAPQVDYLVLPLAQEMVQTAFNEAGRPDAFNQDDIYFVSDTQFAFCAAVNGITVREKVATIFYMGYFYAEALLMTETGNQSGAIQIAGSDAITQIPFFITTCDYTLIGEEFYAASAYLSRNVELVAMLKAQDYFKILIVICVLVGTVISSLGINAFLNFLPVE